MNRRPHAQPRRPRDAKTAAYQDAYREWVASMPKAERQKLAALGLDKPMLPDTQGGGLVDAAELARCDAPEAGCDELEHAPQRGVLTTEQVHDMLRRIVCELIGRDDARLTAECLALITGVVYGGDSMQDLARRHGLSRAAVSKRCIELIRSLRLTPSRAMRPVKTRRASRKSRNTRLNKNETLRSH